MASASSSSDTSAQFHNLVNHMVFTLTLTAVPVEETSHPAFDVHGVTSRSRISLLILVDLPQLAKFMWSALASCQPVSKKAEKLYQISSERFSYFHTCLIDVTHWWWLLSVTGQDLDNPSHPS